MNNKFLNLIFLSILITSISACTKDSVDSVASIQDELKLEIMEYYPPEEVNVRDKVVVFLNHTKTYNPNASFKTEFKDMEANEAMWTLEAASNLLVNKNFKYEADLEGEKLNYKLSFQLNKSDKNLFIEGKELTQSFENLHNRIEDAVKSKNKVPVLIDFTASESKSNMVVFEVTVMLRTTKLADFTQNVEGKESAQIEPCSSDDCLTPDRCTGTNNFDRLACDCSYIISTSAGSYTQLSSIMTKFASCTNPIVQNPNIAFCNIELLRNGGWHTAYQGYQALTQEEEYCAQASATNLLNEDICYAMFHGNVTPDHIFALVDQKRVDVAGNIDAWKIWGAWMGLVF